MKLTASPATARAEGRAAASGALARSSPRLAPTTTTTTSRRRTNADQQQQSTQRPASAAGAARHHRRRRGVACAAASPETEAASAAPDADANAPSSSSASTVPTSPVWELDFCSRPLLDERGKKVWELLITDPDRSFEYSQYFPNSRINSAELRRAVDALLAQAGAVKPDRARFFRGQMSTIITKALTDAGIKAVPSRRCFGVMCEFFLFVRLVLFCRRLTPLNAPALTRRPPAPPPPKNNQQQNSAARGARDQRLPAGPAVQQQRGRRAVALRPRPGRA
jgi:hypothetical protein